MKQAVLLVSHGTVADLDELPAFLRSISSAGGWRQGREPPADLVSELRRRYSAIGGSPLDAINRRLAEKLERLLAIPVRHVARLWHPYASEVVATLDVERVVVIPLAQHSAHVYGEAVKREIGDRVAMICAPNWGQRPALLDALARRVRALASADAALVLTAHSLPKRVIQAGDAYEREVRASAAGVGERVQGAFADVLVAFQSQGPPLAGMSSGPRSDTSEWLGPTLAEAFDWAAARASRVVVAPIGFLADHVEILYDLDIEAKAMAEARGLSFARSESLNDADDFVAVLAEIARELLAR